MHTTLCSIEISAQLPRETQGERN